MLRVAGDKGTVSSSTQQNLINSTHFRILPVSRTRQTMTIRALKETISTRYHGKQMSFQTATCYRVSATLGILNNKNKKLEQERSEIGVPPPTFDRTAVSNRIIRVCVVYSLPDPQFLQWLSQVRVHISRPSLRVRIHGATSVSSQIPR